MSAVIYISRSSGQWGGKGSLRKGHNFGSRGTMPGGGRKKTMPVRYKGTTKQSISNKTSKFLVSFRAWGPKDSRSSGPLTRCAAEREGRVKRDRSRKEGGGGSHKNRPSVFIMFVSSVLQRKGRTSSEERRGEVFSACPDGGKRGRKQRTSPPQIGLTNNRNIQH